MKKYLLLVLTPFLFFTNPVRAELVVPEKPADGLYDPGHHVSQKVSKHLKLITRLVTLKSAFT